MPCWILVFVPTSLEEAPCRTERQFHRYLASTSPQHRILDRYRKVVEVDDVAKLPLDESVDSAISDQSRVSTDLALPTPSPAP